MKIAKADSAGGTASVENGGAPAREIRTKKKLTSPDLGAARKANASAAGDGTARGSAAVSKAAGTPVASAKGPLALQSLKNASPEKLRDSVIKIVVENFDYFRENPKLLSWAMMQWQLIHMGSRLYLKRCDDDGRDAVARAGANKLNDADSDLLHDAWTMTCGQYLDFQDPAREPLGAQIAKPNKTMDEWMAIRTNPLARFHYSERDARSRLLMEPSYRYDWTDDGRLNARTSGGTPVTEFYGYTGAEAEVRPDIRDTLIALTQAPKVAAATRRYLADCAACWDVNRLEYEFHDSMPIFHQTCRGAGYSDADIAKASEAYRTTLYVEELVHQARGWSPEQWATARASDTWTFEGHTIDVSAITHKTCVRPLELRDSVKEGVSVDDLTTNGLSARVAANYLFDKPAPAPGWDTVAFLANPTGFIYTAPKDAPLAKLPEALTEHMVLMHMPQHAHPSYIKAGITTAREIAGNPQEPAKARELAEKFLARFAEK